MFTTVFLTFTNKIRKWTHKPMWLYKRFRIKPDGHLLLGNCSIYFEYDCANEPMSVLIKKIERYEEYAKENPDLFFYVVTILDSKKGKANEGKRLVNFLKSMAKKKYHSFRYLACTMTHFSKLPVENRKILYPYTGPNMSFDDLWEQKKTSNGDLPMAGSSNE